MAVLPSVQQLLLGSVFFSTFYVVTLVFYRLYFSPLAKFPGPKLAAATLWYEFYFDVVKRGRYTWNIADLHTEYGALPLNHRWVLRLTNPPIQVLSYGSVHMNCI